VLVPREKNLRGFRAAGRELCPMLTHHVVLLIKAVLPGARNAQVQIHRELHYFAAAGQGAAAGGLGAGLGDVGGSHVHSPSCAPAAAVTRGPADQARRRARPRARGIAGGRGASVPG
jgi:hypothetical protein